jgi:hypothetical protein
MSETRQLFELLPAVYRVRDAAAGGPLEAFLGVMQDEVDRLREDVEQLYDNWFIETCDDWVVPYIGDLIGVRGLLDIKGTRYSQRGLVADTIALRRRKGTLAVIEQLALDVTDWPAKAVEFFELLAWTQNVNHVRDGQGGTVALGDANALELVDGPFDITAHTADVRHIDIGRGRHNIPNIGVFLWRLGSYHVDRSSARPDPAVAGRYSCNPLGLDTPLFNRPHEEAGIEHLADELSVPGPLRRRALHDELAAGVPDTPEMDDGLERFLSPSEPALDVFLDAVRVKASELAICDLSDPARLAPAGKKAAVDPELGRIALAEGAPAPGEVRLSWSFGFPGDLGGGPYDRRASLASAMPPGSAVSWQMGVVESPPAGEGELAATLTGANGALAQWAGQAQPPELALVVLMDSRSLRENVAVTIPAGCTLVLAAADWPKEDDPLTGVPRRVLGHAVARGVRPHLIGDITVTGAAPTHTAKAGTLVLDGLLIEGAVKVVAGTLGRLRVAHCTLARPVLNPPPAAGKLKVDPGNVGLEVEIAHSICGPIDIAETAHRVTIEDSILDGRGGAALAAPDATVNRTTILGPSAVRSIAASDCIFTGQLDVVRRQGGCVRYSYLPRSSRAPRRFRCHPASDTEAARVAPAFTSLTYGDPGFCQLAGDCPEVIARGASDEGEMGAFNFVQAAHRMANLRARLDEYLRVGLEAGTFFAT